MWTAMRDRFPGGHALDPADRRPVHRLLLWVLGAHVVGLAALGAALGHPPTTLALALVGPAVGLAAGLLVPARSAVAALAVAVGLVCASAALVGLTGLGAARVHVLVVVGLVALYQTWPPLLAVVALAAAGQVLAPPPGLPTLADPAAPGSWASVGALVGGALALAVVVALLWGVGERYRLERDAVGRRLTDVELGRQEFVTELLTNLARRSQGMVYRQLEILGRLQESERDPGTRAELARLDHLAVRVRRNAGNLLVLAGEQAPRTGAGPTSLREVVRAAVAETEDLDRVLFVVDEQPTVAARAVADLTHLLAELVENAVRFSPPDSAVTVRSHPDQGGRGRVLTVEDLGVGLSEPAATEANALLADPPEIDLAVTQRLGLHVVARLALRHRIRVSLGAGAESGTVCTVARPEALFEPGADGGGPAADVPAAAAPEPPATADRPDAAARAGEPAATGAHAGSPVELSGDRLFRSEPAAGPTAGPTPEPTAEPAAPADRQPAPATTRLPVGRPAGATAGAGAPGRDAPAAEPTAPRPAPAPAHSAVTARILLPAAPGAAEPPTSRFPVTHPSPPSPGAGSSAPRAAETSAPRLPAVPPGSSREPAPTGSSRRPAVEQPAPAATGSTPGMARTRPDESSPGMPTGPRTPAPPRPAPARPGADADTPSDGIPVVRPASSSPGLPAVRPAPARTAPSTEASDPRLPAVGPDARPAPARAADEPTGPRTDAMPRRHPGRRAPGPVGAPAPFGTSGRWEGWWEAGADSPSPVAATAPSSTGPWPVVAPGTDRHGVPGPRPRPPVAAPPGPLRPPRPAVPRPTPPSTAPIAWVDPPDRTREASGPPVGGPELFSSRAELRRRVPQASLAPELRVPAPAEPPARGTTPPGATDEAVSALSRYQASRAAARTAVRTTPGPITPEPATAPANGRTGDRDHPIATDDAAERYTPARTDESVSDVPLDAAGDERSTAQERTPDGGIAPDPATAAGDRAPAGENRAMDGDAADNAADDAAAADIAGPTGARDGGR